MEKQYAYSKDGVTQAAREAKEADYKRFTWVCSRHGEQQYYSSSKSCPVCTFERRDKEHQSAYNLAVKHKYENYKRADGTWSRRKIV